MPATKKGNVGQMGGQPTAKVNCEPIIDKRMWAAYNVKGKLITIKGTRGEAANWEVPGQTVRKVKVTITPV